MCAVLFLKLFFQWLAYLAGQFMFLIWMQWEEEEETKTDTPKAYWLKLQQFLWPFTATMEKDGFCHILWYLHFSNTKTGPGKTWKLWPIMKKRTKSISCVTVRDTHTVSWGKARKRATVNDSCVCNCNRA